MYPKTIGQSYLRATVGEGARHASFTLSDWWLPQWQQVSLDFNVTTEAFDAAGSMLGDCAVAALGFGAVESSLSSGCSVEPM